MRKIIFIILLIISTHSYSNGFKSESEIRKFFDVIVEHFVNKEFTTGLNLAKPYWPIPSVEIDGLANQIKKQWPVIDQRFGKSLSKEFIKSEKIGGSFIRYYYLQKFDKHAVYWQIDLYKPVNSWKINNITFNDNVGVLFE